MKKKGLSKRSIAYLQSPFSSDEEYEKKKAEFIENARKEGKITGYFEYRSQPFYVIKMS